MAKLSDADLRRARDEYERDGATVLRGVVPSELIAVVGEAVDRIMQPTDHANFVSGENLAEEGKFFQSNFAWLRDPDLQTLIRMSDLARCAGELMGADVVRFFYDQILVKEPGTKNRTPWHQDMPYYPFSGEQLVSLWVAIDEATPENGVVTYVKGSHRWNRLFPMQAFGARQQAMMDGHVQEAEPGTYAAEDGNPRTLADIRDNPQNYELVSWSVEPGDCLVHHSMTVHGASGNTSQTMRRRAVATRWLGDDIRWDDSRPNFVRALRSIKNFPTPDLRQGDYPADDLFPVIWQRAPASA